MFIPKRKRGSRVDFHSFRDDLVYARLPMVRVVIPVSENLVQVDFPPISHKFTFATPVLVGQS